MLRFDDNAVIDCLFEDIPSDDQSFNSVDNSDDDRDYLPPKRPFL